MTSFSKLFAANVASKWCYVYQFSVCNQMTSFCKLFLQISHLNLVPCINFKCAIRWRVSVNCLPRIPHLNRVPCIGFKCATRWGVPVNCLPQVSHLNSVPCIGFKCVIIYLKWLMAYVLYNNASLLLVLLQLLLTQNSHNSANFKATTSGFCMVIDINDTYRLYVSAKS